MMSDAIEVSSGVSSSDEEGPTPAKRRRTDRSDANLSFKEKVQNILETLTDAAPGEFAVCGKLNAPMITIAIKVNILSESTD